MEVSYDEEHWKLLNRLRTKATKIMAILAQRNILSGIHGSVTRGDVHHDSDVDIIVLDQIGSHPIELALTLAGLQLYTRRIAQATPSHTPKGHIYLDPQEKTSVTFPLLSFRSLELEFYRFGGYLTLTGIQDNKRCPGCDKKLMLIQPTIKGHTESPVVGHEVEAAKIVGVNLEIVQERVRVLTRRRDIGRTGIVISINLEEGEVFEDALRRAAGSNPILARRMRSV